LRESRDSLITIQNLRHRGAIGDMPMILRMSFASIAALGLMAGGRALGQNGRDRLYWYVAVGGCDPLFPRHGRFHKHLEELGVRYSRVVHSKVAHDLGVCTELSGRTMIEHPPCELLRNISRL
jgi:hypothetical protein